MPEFSIDKVFMLRLFKRFPHKIYLGKGERESLITTGMAYVHKLNKGSLVVCLKRMNASGCPCPYCEFSEPEAKLFEMHKTDVGYRLTEQPITHVGTRKQSIPITVALSWCTALDKTMLEHSKYKNPFAFGSLNSLKVFPSYLMPELSAYYKKYYEWSLKIFERYEK